MMADEAAQAYVETLLDYQFDLLWVRNYGLNHAEFLFTEAARVLKQYMGIRSWFLELVESSMLQHRGVIDGRIQVRPQSYVPDAFVLFVVHRTRWAEFRDLAARMRDRTEDIWLTNLLDRWSEKLASALRDDWEDREFYEIFGAGPRV